MNPNFPLYIPSKGRTESRFTVKTLEYMRVPYSIIVEEQEYKEYASVIDKKNILVLDKSFQDKYDAFSDLGITSSKGSGPARNFAWEHSISIGAKYHWIMDDNIKYFYRLNNHLKIKVSDGTIFRVMEDFVLRYSNVAMAGPNYLFFAKQNQKLNPFILNTRIYSCNLIRNDVPFRWRGRYNEDTDLSLRMLKSGWCTILFNAFLQGKTRTMTLKGGNTDTIYKDGTYAKSKMLVDMHPDVARLSYKFGRCHHHVDYTSFKNTRLIRCKDVSITDSINNYGMELKKIK